MATITTRRRWRICSKKYETFVENKPKQTDYIQDYFLQLGAYTLAHNVVYKTSITSGIILLCTVDNLFQDFKIDGAELIMYQNLFLGRLKKLNELKNLPWHLKFNVYIYNH